MLQQRHEALFFEKPSKFEHVCFGQLSFGKSKYHDVVAHNEIDHLIILPCNVKKSNKILQLHAEYRNLKYI